MKVTAIACASGPSPRTDYLIDQAASKTQDARGRVPALARIDHPAAVAVLAKAIQGKDFHLAAQPPSATARARPRRRPGGRDPHVGGCVREAEGQEEGVRRRRPHDGPRQRPGRTPRPPSSTLLLDLFARRAELAKIKGSLYSGTDVVESVVSQMSDGSEAGGGCWSRPTPSWSRTNSSRRLRPAARTCRRSSCTTRSARTCRRPSASGEELARTLEWEKAEAILDGIDSDFYVYSWLNPHDEDDDDTDDDSELDDEPVRERPTPQPYDPRWLDLAVAAKHTDAVQALGRAGSRRERWRSPGPSSTRH